MSHVYGDWLKEGAEKEFEQLPVSGLTGVVSMGVAARKMSHSFVIQSLH